MLLDCLNNVTNISCVYSQNMGKRLPFVHWQQVLKLSDTREIAENYAKLLVGRFALDTQEHNMFIKLDVIGAKSTPTPLSHRKRIIMFSHILSRLSPHTKRFVKEKKKISSSHTRSTGGLK